MSTKRLLLALSTGLIFTANIAMAGVSDDAQRAYNSGDYAKAFPLLDSQAKKDDAVAQYLLGLSYARGLGVAKDSKAAVSWWAKSAAKGNTDAQESLGESYATGVGIAQDFSKAVEWVSKAAEKGHANGQYVLGTLHEAGLGGLKASAIEAYKWYFLAAGSVNGFPPATDAMKRLEKTTSPADVAAAKAKAEKWRADQKAAADKAAATSKKK